MTGKLYILIVLNSVMTGIITQLHGQSIQNIQWNLNEYYYNCQWENHGLKNQTMIFKGNSMTHKLPCNNAYSKYEIMNDSIHLNGLMKTKVGCYNADAIFEGILYHSISRIDNYKLQGDTLTLYNGTTPLLKYLKQ